MKEITVKTSLSVAEPVSICPECFEKNREFYERGLIVYCEHNQTGGKAEIHQVLNHEGALVNQADTWIITGPVSKKQFIKHIIERSFPCYGQSIYDDNIPF